ncbi:cardiolipin synthase [Paenibacillaceae bacterium WGS1546]|uniref:cardiolipin synthase n=1 Tax=Cohnella sp. WGS1546 TaxID=3366810 RepID=UPI00372D6621
MFWIIMALVWFIIQIAVIVLVEYRQPGKAVTWIVILFMIPIFGFVLYYFLARSYSWPLRMRKEQEALKEMLVEKSKRKIPNDRLKETFNEEAVWLQNRTSAPVTSGNESTVFSEGREAFNAMLESIAAAEHHIHIESYILRDDHLGARFERLLTRKAQEGVEVRLLYDGIGSRQLTKVYLNRLKRTGVETGCFFPMLATFMNKRINYRNHRKIVVVDGKVGFFGGLNIGDEYEGKNPKYGYWRDTHFRIEGNAVLWIQYAFLTDWHMVKGKLLTDPAYYPDQDDQGEEFVQIVNSIPDETMLELMFSFIVSAKKRIFIETPYFVLEPGIQLALKVAVKNGVDVRVIIPGTPDKKLVYNASLSYVQDLLKAGVRFYYYRKGFLHAKVIISDDFACSGSANMDMRSFSGQFEMNAIYYDGKIVKRLVQDFYMDLDVSEEIVLAEFEKRHQLQKLKEIFARLLSPLL